MPLQAIQPGCWVAKLKGDDHPEIARVKYVRQVGIGQQQEPLMDAVLYSITGERLCKGVPPLGETECYAQGLSLEGWRVIHKPDFELLPLVLEMHLKPVIAMHQATLAAGPKPSTNREHEAHARHHTF